MYNSQEPKKNLEIYLKKKRNSVFIRKCYYLIKAFFSKCYIRKQTESHIGWLLLFLYLWSNCNWSKLFKRPPIEQNL
jgi:hypothetical protein